MGSEEPADVARDELVPLTRAADFFPKRGGRNLGVKALRRRIHTGQRGVRLRAVRDGGQWFTSKEWVEEYLEAVTAKYVPQVRSPAATARAVARARAELERKYGPRRARTSERSKRILSERYGIHNAK